MKINKIAFAFAACLCIFISCSKETDEPVDNNVKVKMVLGVGTQISKTRTSIVGLDFTHTSQDVHWSNTDKLSVFAEGHEMGDVFSWKSWVSDELHNIANFEGYSYEIEDNKSYYVLYPAQTNARLVSTSDGPRLKFNIPNVQHAVVNSFDPAADIQAGKASSLRSKTDLQNACAFFYITLEPGYSQVDVSVDDNTEWHLAGTVSAEVTSNSVAIKGFESDCTNEISLLDTEEGGTYFIAFIPTSGFKHKLNLTLHKINAGGVMTLQFEKSEGGLQFAGGNYYNLGSY